MTSDADRSELSSRALAGAQRWTDELEAFSDAHQQLADARARLLNQKTPASRRQPLTLRSGLLALGLAPLLAAAAFLLVRAHAVPAPSFAVRASASGAAVAARPGGEISSPLGQERILSFWERSEVRLGPGAKAKVTELTPRGAKLELVAGDAEVRITPSANSTWEVVVGRFRVAVLGTHFFISKPATEDGLTIRLVEGHVSVSSACLIAPEQVSAGERRAFRCNETAELPSTTAVPVLDTPHSGAAPGAVDKPGIDAPDKTAADGATPKTPSALRQEVEMVESIRAALTADPSRALALIQEARKRFPKGSLNEDRAAFEVLALERLGRNAEAEALAQRFLLRYPKGPFSARLKRLGSKPRP